MSHGPKRSLVEHHLSLDSNVVRRLGEADPVGALRWHGSPFSVQYRYDARSGSVTLVFPNDRHTQRIRLTNYAIYNGGYKTLFDLGNRRVARLYFDGALFRSRHVLGPLRYRSQALHRTDEREKLRVEKILRRIGPGGDAIKRDGLRRRHWAKLVTRLHELLPPIGDPGPSPG
jgi:hypothetical protein